jgi:hypothetical protein
MDVDHGAAGFNVLERAVGLLLDRRSRNLGHIIRRDPGFDASHSQTATLPQCVKYSAQQKLWQLSY